ncbi:TldD/PmbA family protein [Saccharolobus islandicus]|uniref:TldD/PmbA family protein n=1 Tax=Saccharolobus islandicus TaxID=43080 RepID=UPI00241FE8B7|nr:TldD/PmbA family protein [Sulfolobus islandicus]
MENDTLNEANKIVSEAINRGADEAAIMIYHRRELMIKIAKSRITVTQNWDNNYYGIYLTKNKRKAIGYTSSDPKGSIENLLKAINVMEEYNYTPLPTNEKTVKVNREYKSITNLMKNRSDLINKVLDVCSDKEVYGTLSLEKFERTLVTSKGFEGKESGTRYFLSFRVFKGENSGHWVSSGNDINYNIISNAIDKATYYADISSSKVDLTEGKYEVVLSPIVFGNLIDNLGWMSSALSVETNRSIFSKFNEGSKVVSEKITLSDEPRRESYGFAFFDDEGLDTKNKNVIENGILKTLLYNSSLAFKRNKESTGNAGWISPRPWFLTIREGDISEDSLIGGVKNGIFFNSNWYTRWQNYVEGNFSTVGRDAILIIKEGKIIGSTSRLRIADNILSMLNNVEGIGNKGYPIRWWEVETPVYVPMIHIKNVNISKAYI